MLGVLGDNKNKENICLPYHLLVSLKKEGMQSFWPLLNNIQEVPIYELHDIIIKAPPPPDKI